MKNIAVAFGILFLAACVSSDQSEEFQAIDTTSTLAVDTLSGDSTVSVSDTTSADTTKDSI